MIMAGIRVTGLASGLDTESLVQQLSDAYQTKVDNAKKQQTKAEWKKEAWASLNTKIYSFYKDSLNMFKSTSTYNTKSVSGELSGVKITAGNKAVNGTHKVKVNSTASAQMWTGDKINTGTYKATSYVGATDTSGALYDSVGNELDLSSLQGKTITVKVGDSEEKTITIGTSVNSVDSLVGDIQKQLDDSSVGLKVGFVNGALTFENTTTTKSTTEDGETTYTGGQDIKITADNVLGLTSDGITAKAMSETNDVTIAKTSTFAYNKVETEGSAVTGSTKLTDLNIDEGTEYTVTVGDKTTTITVGKTTTLSSFASELSKLGLNASYDAGQGRFYISAKDTGTANEFDIQADTNTNALSALGLDFSGSSDTVGKKIAATNAEIEYNGVTYTQSNNSFSINGLTIEALEAAGKDDPAQTITVSTDAQGIYDKVKSFLKEYNSLISEMNKLYSADSSRGYDPLTSDEKEAMSDDEVEQWETKIKDSLLRRDSTIGNLLSSMRTTLNKSVEVTNPDGTTTRYNLASFGIETGDYTEKGQLHIYGDSDDSTYADKDDKLLAAIMANPDAVTQTLTTLGSEMYTNLQNAMKRTELSSALTFYNDKQLDSEISDYKDKVTELQEKLQEEEDRYYEQFSAMEKAMTQLQSKQNYISQLFGG